MASRRSGETAYARHQRHIRKQTRDKERNKGSRGHVAAAAGAKCGVRKRDGGTCQQVAGFGTTHKGMGPCKYHGGSLPTVVAHHVKNAAVLLGAPKEINPLDAIIWCIKLTGGEIDFYTEQISYIKHENWLEDTPLGKQMHIFARERALAQERLVNFSKIAVSLGLTERAVRLAEQYGATISTLLRGLLNDLEPYLSDEGKALTPQFIRKHLMIAEKGRTEANSFAQSQATKELKA